MTLAKRLLLGSAAAVVATTGAQAADLGLPVAPAVDYVQICSIGSFTGFILPGSDVCFDISGYARWQLTLNEESGANGATSDFDDYDMIGEFELRFDARTNTEYGLLRGFIQLGNTAGTTAAVEEAFVQFGGLTAGYSDSFFDGVYTGMALGAIGGFYGDIDTAMIHYAYAVGNGVTLTIGAEDDEARQTVTNPVGAALAAGLTATAYDLSATTPDIMATVRVDQAWGSAKLAAVLHEVDPGLAAVDSEFGYAIGASATFNLPVGYTSEFGVYGTYAHGAVGYVGFDAGAAGNALTYVDFLYNSTNTSVELTTAYAIGAGVEFGLTPELDFELDAQYASVDHDTSSLTLANAAVDGDYAMWSVRSSLEWRPVAGLSIHGGIDYISIDANAAELSNNDDDEIAGRLRITRSF